MLENLNTKIRIGKCVYTYILDRVYWITQMPVLKRIGNEKHCRLGMHTISYRHFVHFRPYDGDATAMLHTANNKCDKRQLSAPGNSSIVCWSRCFQHVPTFQCIVTFNVKKVYVWDWSKRFPAYIFSSVCSYTVEYVHIYMHNTRRA